MCMTRLQFYVKDPVSVNANLRGQCLVANQEFLIFPREDIVGHRRDVILRPKLLTESERKRGFPRSDRPGGTNVTDGSLP